MKFIKLILFCFLLTNVQNTQSAVVFSDPVTTEVHREISALLGKPANPVPGESLTAEVYFLINSKREIVVINVATDSEWLELYVKSRLNYQKIKDYSLLPGKKYLVPLRIIPGK